MKLFACNLKLMHFKETYNSPIPRKVRMPKDLFMTKYLQGDKNATFILYVTNSKQIPSAIGKKEMIFSDAKQIHFALIIV